jgi:hypothetical protein
VMCAIRGSASAPGAASERAASGPIHFLRGRYAASELPAASNRL